MSRMTSEAFFSNLADALSGLEELMDGGVVIRGLKKKTPRTLWGSRRLRSV